MRCWPQQVAIEMDPGVWLVRAEDPDPRAVYSEVKVTENRWDTDIVLSLKVTPWHLEDIEVRAQVAAAG